MILLHVGRVEMARDLFHQGADWSVPESETRPSLLTTEFLGDVHLEQGEAEPALRYYEEVWPKALALVPKGDIVAELRRRRAECYLLIGRIAESYEEAMTGLEHCRELGDRYEEAATYRVLALSAAALGKTAEAKQWFDQGFAYYDDIETPYEWGKLWLSYGDWLNSAASAEYRDPRGALEAYQAACDHFERMGAEAKLVEATTRLNALTPPRIPRAIETTEAKSEAGETRTRRPQRRPRGASELERRSQWALEQFGLLTTSQRMLRVLEDVGKLARSTSPILVLGESGTGKELIAHGIHRLSQRSGTFMPINCGALPREIIESELFGHVSGAFTGAMKDRAGLFETCENGTVFLDEVAELALELQTRLLRFLETGEVRRVGANRTWAVNTRVVAATNQERAGLEAGKGFRTDLYYRLAHAVVQLPPLRQRDRDVTLLIDHFLEQSGREERKTVKLSAGARQRMEAYPWPGNVRQLKSTVKRLVLLSPVEHEVQEHELMLDDGRVPANLAEELNVTEKSRVAEAVAQARGSRTEAAKALGIPRTTLLHKMRRFGIK
jgi:DNA-binding NtrC family response regulator